jgi:F-type H+-transporting ATPase subunit gamma
MASLKSIRNRIRSVKNMQQITRAMKMVAAARLRRAQEAALSARPYSQQLAAVLDEMLRRETVARHPLMQARPVKRVELVLLTSDRGLCGGFNSNVIRATQRFLIHRGDELEQVTLRTIGRKGYDAFRRRGANIRKDHAGLLSRLNPAESEEIARELTGLYLEGEVDAVMLVYNEFVSAVTQRVKTVELLPIASRQTEETAAVSHAEYLWEPDREAVTNELLPRYVANQVWQALLESIAAENAARMSAMESATNNAAEMIERLTLQYNRTRQAGITTELMEIVSGAEALK